MALRTAGSLFVFLCSVAVVLGQDGFTVSHTNQSVCVLRGSSVDLPCSYTYPRGQTVKDTGWFTRKSGGWSHIQDQPEYAGRVEYLGDKKRDCTLRITDLRETDSTTYYFRFKASSSTAYRGGTDKVSLSVTDLQVKVPPSTWGQTVNLTCSSSCPLTGNPSYIWYMNGRLQQTTSQQVSVFSYYPSSYSCAVEGHEDLRSPAVCVIDLQTYQTCSRVTYSIRRVCVLKGSSVDIPCTYYSYYSVRSAFWFRPEQRDRWRDGSTPEDLAGDPEFAGRVQYSGTERRDSTLRITDLRESDSAEYRFMFKTLLKDYDWGASFPGSTLTVTGLQVKVTVTEGQRVTLTCSSSCPLTGNPSYIWYKNGQRLQQTTSQQVAVSSSYEPSYSCAVEGHEDLHSPAVCVIGQTCSRVTYSMRRVCVLKGSSVDISCTYYSLYSVRSAFWFRPEQTDKWRDGSTPEDLAGDPEFAGRVQYSGTERRDSTLTITDLRESDAAEYRFMLKTHYEDYDWGASFPGSTLTVTGLQVKVTVTEGQRVTLTCSSSCPLTGNPSYIWYKNGQRLQQTTSHQVSVSSSSQDSYSCAVEGHEDLRSPPVYKPKSLRVSVSPPGEIVEGSSVTLTCSGDANPPVDTYTWYKEKDTSSKASGQSYTITNITSEDRGQYSCEAQNEVGSAMSDQFPVNVSSASPWAPGVLVVVLVLVLLSVLAAGALLVLLCWTLKRRSNRGSDVTGDAQIPVSPQRDQPDPSSDTYTALHVRTRASDYDTLANVNDFTETYSSLDMRTRSSAYDTLAIVTQDQDEYDDVDQEEHNDVDQDEYDDADQDTHRPPE